MSVKNRRSRDKGHIGGRGARIRALPHSDRRVADWVEASGNDTYSSGHGEVAGVGNIVGELIIVGVGGLVGLVGRREERVLRRSASVRKRSSSQLPAGAAVAASRLTMSKGIRSAGGRRQSWIQG